MLRGATKKLFHARALGVTLFGGLILPATACAAITGPTETREDNFRVGPSPRLVVNSENGYVSVRAAQGNTINVRATLRNAPRVNYSATQSGDTVTVVAESRGRFFSFGDSGADIEITAPAATTIGLRTSNGRVEVEGLQAPGTFRTSNGRITMENIHGDFEAETSNGEISVHQAVGSFKLETSNGRIEFRGELRPGSRNEMRTSNGAVSVELMGQPSVRLDASTRNGSVNSSLPITTTSSGDRNSIIGTIGSDESELLIRTSNGSITIQ